MMLFIQANALFNNSYFTIKGMMMATQVLELRPISPPVSARTAATFVPEIPIRSKAREEGAQRSHIVPMLSRALRIIDIMKKQRTYISAQQITTMTGYSRSSVYRILRTLVAHDYLLEDEKGGFILCHTLRSHRKT